MQPLTIEWIQKAEGDLATAHRELRARTGGGNQPGDVEELSKVSWNSPN